MSKTMENLGVADEKKDTPKGADPISVTSKTTAETLVLEWRFKKKQPFYLINLVGTKETALQDPAQAEGRTFVHTLKVRDWKLDLNPLDPVDVLVSKKLMTHDMFGIDFWPMVNTKGEASLSDKAALLRHLMDMNRVQLEQQMSRDEWAEVGILPAEVDQMTLIVAIMGKKKIITKGTK